ncbi:MAG: DNRLRE domain-containing protein [Xenococcaceae cyanobacterium]
MLQEASPNANDSNATSLNVDSSDRGGAVQGLIRFDDIFGSQDGQITDNAEIKSATLELDVDNPGNSLEFYRMVEGWSDNTTWNSLGNGIQTNGTEAASTPDATTGEVSTGLLSIDVTESVKAWQNDPSSNYGWAILPTGANGVDFDSAEGTTKPRLVVEYKENTPVDPAKTELAWEDQNLVDEAAVTSGTSFNLGGGLTATVNWETQTNGGSFIAAKGSDFVSYEQGTKGGDKGYLNLGFDNDTRDPGDLIQVSLKFNQAVTGLSFSLLDVDQGKSFDDAVEIYADEVNILDNPDITYSLGGNDVKLDNETYMKGFEGRGGASSAETTGNIQVELGSASVSEITVAYFSTDDSTGDPSSQSIGISDLSWTAS